LKTGAAIYAPQLGPAKQLIAVEHMCYNQCTAAETGQQAMA